MARPGSSLRLRGRGESLAEVVKPGEEEREEDEDVSMSWRSFGSVLDLYSPGRRWRVGSEPLEREAPMETFE